MVTLLKDPSKTPHKDYLICDVRDDDRVGGHILSSVNYPSHQFYGSTIDGLVEKTKDVPIMVFHCALSQVRSVYTLF